jgi:hypothetical protein
VSDEELDPTAERLDAFAAGLRSRLVGVASLTDEPLGRRSWLLTPERRGAVGVAWNDWGDALQVQVLGGQGGRWELGRNVADLDFLIGVVEAVVEGRATETFGRKRSQVSVTLADGTIASETGYGPGGCLPQFRWRRRGMTKRYSPY